MIEILTPSPHPLPIGERERVRGFLVIGHWEIAIYLEFGIWLLEFLISFPGAPIDNQAVLFR